jgi:hypothetical protein
MLGTQIESIKYYWLMLQFISFLIVKKKYSLNQLKSGCKEYF